MRKIVVVGGSAAGMAAVQALRDCGSRAHITIVGEEGFLPYDRPPLSKAFIAAGLPVESIQLNDQASLNALGAEWRLKARACDIDPVARSITLDDGSKIMFDGLIIATGVAPRSLHKTRPVGVMTLRTVQDATLLRDALAHRPKVAVIGTGILGMEVAATARKLGLDVTVIGSTSHPLAKQFPAAIGKLLADKHRLEGVDIRSDARVAELVEKDEALTGVRLETGEVVASELAVVAVGSSPNTEWLARSGLDVRDGVICDPTCCAAPGIFAAGDVASWWHTGYGMRMRVEHRMNAVEQAQCAVRNLLGGNNSFRPVPFMWTDQYDIKLQAYGIFPENADIEWEGEVVGDGHFVGLWHRAGRPVGALGWNAAKALRHAQARIVEGMKGVHVDEPFA